VPLATCLDPRRFLVKQIRKRLTYANVMSSIAVFLVLGGATALAAGQLGKNSVGSKQLKKNAVTAAKVKNNAVTTAKIKDGAVTGAKINLGSLGTVPSATSSTNAGNANTVNGQTATKIFAKLPKGAGTTNIGSFAGFSLTASCPDLVAERIVIELHPPANVPSVLTSLTTGNGNTDVVQEYEAGTNETIFLSNESLGESTFSAATTNGTVISGNLGFDYPDTFSSETVCVVYGEVTSG
jgi:hypothetical protein